MQLVPDQLRQFQTDGYLVLPRFFDAREVNAMQKELARLKSAWLLRNVATDGDGKTQSKTLQNLQICPLTPKSDLFRALPFADKVVAVVHQLIGDPILHHLDQIFLKPGKSGAGTGWHQDNAYFHLSDSTKGTGMWVAVHDATVANGTMHIVPRGFAKPLEHTRDGGSDHHIRCLVDESQVLPIEMKAGGALFFNYGVPHCTLGNTTDKERAGLALHFVRQDYLPADDAMGGKRNSEKSILTGPGATGGQREFGCRLTGAWPHEVERVLAV